MTTWAKHRPYLHYRREVESMVEGVEMSLLIGEVALPFVLAGILIVVIVIIERRERRH